MRKIIVILTTVFFVVLLFRIINVKEAVDIISSAKINLILAAIVLGVVQTYLSANRMRILVSILAKVKTSYFFWMGYLTSLISMIFPFFVGGFSFAFFLSKKIKSTYAKTFSIAFIDFGLGVSASFLLATISIFYFGSKRVINVSNLGFGNIVFFAFGVIAIMITAYVLSKKSEYLNKVFSRLQRGIELFAKKKAILLKAVLLTAPIAALNFASFYLFFLALGLHPGFIDFVLAASLLSVLNLIPGAIAKIGQYETLGVLTLPYLLSLDKTGVFSALLLQHTVSLITVGIMGTAAAHYLSRDFGGLTKPLTFLRGFGRGGGKIT